MKRIAAAVSTAVVCAATGIFSLSMFVTDGFSSNPESPSALRKTLLHTQQSLSLSLGQDCINGVFITDDRLFVRHDFYSSEAVRENVDAVNAYAQRNSAPLYWLVAPTAAGIYADTIPVGASQASELSMMNNAMEQLDPSVTWVDVNSTLYDARDAYLYYRNDHRWTTEGAFHAYKAAIRKLGLSNLGRDRFASSIFTTEFRGDLAQISECDVFDTDIVELFSCADAPPIASIIGTKSGERYSSFYQTDQTEPLAVFLPEREPVIQVETEVHNNKRLVVLCDEYGSNFVPFLTNHFRSLTVVNLTIAEASDVPSISDDGSTQVLLLSSADTLSKHGGLRILSQTELPKNQDSP